MLLFFWLWFTQTKQFFDGSLFFTAGLSVTIIPCKTESQYYLVDSHAWDTEEKPDSNGSRILTKFKNILELISYITNIYENTRTITQYEVQILRIDISDD